jgi:hypothetical protein
MLMMMRTWQETVDCIFEKAERKTERGTSAGRTKR